MHPSDRNAAIAGGIVVLSMWIGGFLAPELFAQAPSGLEATLTAALMALISYITPDPND